VHTCTECCFSSAAPFRTEHPPVLSNWVRRLDPTRNWVFLDRTAASPGLINTPLQPLQSAQDNHQDFPLPKRAPYPIPLLGSLGGGVRECRQPACLHLRCRGLQHTFLRLAPVLPAAARFDPLFGPGRRRPAASLFLPKWPNRGKTSRMHFGVVRGWRGSITDLPAPTFGTRRRCATSGWPVPASAAAAPFKPLVGLG
jgi:hypothetical protein